MAASAVGAGAQAEVVGPTAALNSARAGPSAAAASSASSGQSPAPETTKSSAPAAAHQRAVNALDAAT
ncbi:hypothetical protein [Nocardia bovistercoris]|uniref:hypothetical protein n=1 Tax=Nocardia bovistercoris TaxID=2785916 RepID=UPI001E37FE36|nr:hypothetical protein [Nocardia bovistercoris]